MRDDIDASNAPEILTSLSSLFSLVVPCMCYPTLLGHRNERESSLERKPSGNTSGVRLSLIRLVLFRHPSISERGEFKMF